MGISLGAVHNAYAVTLVVAGLVLGAVWWFAAAQQTRRRYLIAAYRLADDDWTHAILDRYLRTAAHAEAIGIAVALSVLGILPDPAGKEPESAVWVLFWIAMCAGLIVGGTIGGTRAMRRRAAPDSVRRASLEPRDARRFVPRYFVAATRVFAAVAAVSGAFVLALESLSTAARGAVVLGMAASVVAAAAIVPLANHLSRIPTRSDSAEHDRVEQVLRGASVRQVAGAALALSILGVGAITTFAFGLRLLAGPIVFVCLAQCAESYTRPGVRVPQRLAEFFTPMAARV